MIKSDWILTKQRHWSSDKVNEFIMASYQPPVVYIMYSCQSCWLVGPCLCFFIIRLQLRRFCLHQFIMAPYQPPEVYIMYSCQSCVIFPYYIYSFTTILLTSVHNGPLSTTCRVHNVLVSVLSCSISLCTWTLCARLAL